MFSRKATPPSTAWRGRPNKFAKPKPKAVAFVVCQAIGLDPGTSCADYIQMWQGDAKLLQESLQAVKETATVILGGIAPEVSGLSEDTLPIVPDKM